LLLPSCNKEDNSEEFDRQAMLNNMASAIIEPTVSDLADKLMILETKSSDFTTSPTLTSLNELKVSYLEANKSFQHFKVLNIGPYMTYSIKNTMNTYPTDTVKIENNISSGSYVLGAAQNSAAIGLPCLDYLLYYKDEALTVELYSSDPEATSRSLYLNEIVSKMKNELNLASSNWTDYKVDFLASTGNDVASSTNTLFNEYIKDIELIKNAKIGIPAGNQTGGQTLPSYVEGFFGGHSLLLAKENLNGLLDFYKGGEGIGFDDYLTDVQGEDGTLSQDITNQFGAIQDKIDVLLGPLSADIDANSTAVNELYLELKSLVTFTKTDMSSALGLLITYQDNDGD
jgi:hypothetical protein